MRIPISKYNWNTPLADRQDVFIPEQLCVQPTTEFGAHEGMIPCRAIMDWLTDVKQPFTIHSPFPDGCSIYLIKPDNETLVEFKIRFPEIRT